MTAAARAACSKQADRKGGPLALRARVGVLHRACFAVCLVCSAWSGCAAVHVPSTPLQIGEVTGAMVRANAEETGALGLRSSTDAPRAFTRLELDGIGDCNTPMRDSLVLDVKRPLVVLVHGSHSSTDSFRALAEIFALHDQQTVCFRYPDRESLAASAARLRRGISRLAQALHEPEIMVFGHSQGGLIARAALSAPKLATVLDRRLENRPLPVGSYRLVTVSSPFAGIRAARKCGSIPYHIASLGVSLVVCRSISGAKWNEIHPRSRMVRHPGTLDPMVREHLSIVTDERDTCRRYSPDGTRCLQDDYVFSLAEQRNQRIERDDRVIENSIAAGHSEVLGARGEPKKLLQALQRNGLLRSTHPEDQPAVERLTAGRAW